MILGYVAEQKLKEIISTLTDVSFITKFDDHNRKKKGDLYKYTKQQRSNLIASLIPVKWPPEIPFRNDLKSLLAEMIKAGLGQDPEKIE